MINLPILGRFALFVPRLEENVSMSWHCLKCHTPLSDTYHSYDIPVENMFDTLASIPGDDTVFNRSTVSASPPRLRWDIAAHTLPVAAYPVAPNHLGVTQRHTPPA